MNLEIETVMAISIMLAVFAAIATLGSCIVLGVGFERLRAGFERISKQTGFFSEMLNRLETKVEIVDGKTEAFSKSINRLELQVDGVTEQANAFSGAIQRLAKRVDEESALKPAEEEVVDKRSNIQRYFSADVSPVLAAAQQAKETARDKTIERLNAVANEAGHHAPQPAKAGKAWTENIDFSSLTVQ